MVRGEHSHPHPYPPIEGGEDEVTFSSLASRQSERRALPEEELSASSPAVNNASEREPPGAMWPQYFAAAAATTGGLVMGTAIGWTGPALNLLIPNTTSGSPPPEFPVTDNQGNFIASLMPAGAFCGGLIGGVLVGRFGRRATLFWTTAFFALAYLCLAAAQNVWMLFIGRYLSGMAAGITTIAAPMYVSETSSPHVRGMLGSGFQVMITIGVLYVDIVGALCSWRWLSVACIALCLLWGILMLFVPESPAYLLSIKDYDGARDAMQFLRGHPYIETELSEIQLSIEEAARKTFNPSDLIEPQNMKPLVIALMLMVGQQLSGVNAVIFFSVSIFEAAQTPLNSFVESIIVASTMVVATVIAALIIDRLGRRILLNVSALLMLITIYLLGLYFWIQKTHPDIAAKIGFLPLGSLCIYVFAFSIGFGPIPWLMMSELFSPEIKSITSSITASFNWTLAFCVTEFYGPVSKAVGPAATFWAFASILVLVLAFCVFFVPETKGKSLEEIQQLFRSDQRDDDEEQILDDTDDTLEEQVHNEISVVSA